MNHQVEKPQHRNVFRKKLGKEYFCLKRKLEWYSCRNKWVKKQEVFHLSEIAVEHQSFLLRKLKNVDMYLQHNKTKNLELAIQNINGIILEPGETFSFWKLVKRPSKRKGYLDGLVLSNGQIGKGTGGGLCQLGNLIYWMAIHTPLKIKQRWRHSYDVFPDVNRKIPFGSGATLSYNYIDLQIENETDQKYQINIWLEEEHVKGNICSDQNIDSIYRVYESDHQFKLQWWGGYTRHNKIWREVTVKNTLETKHQLITENHAIMMYNPLLK